MENINSKKNIEKKTVNNLIKEKEEFKNNSKIIREFNLSNNRQIGNLLNKGDEKINLYATLCPFYNEIGIKGDYENFADIDKKFQNKLEASLEIIEFLGKTFNLNIKFLIADQGVLLDKNKYNFENFDKDISGIQKIYSEEISKTLGDSFEIESFTDFGFKVDKICDLSEDKNLDDINDILGKFGVNVEKFQNNLNIIINAFGETGAYFLIKSYLEENDQFLEKIENSIFLNIEAVSALNQPYVKGKNKMDSKNVFARASLYAR